MPDSRSLRRRIAEEEARLARIELDVAKIQSLARKEDVSAIISPRSGDTAKTKCSIS